MLRSKLHLYTLSLFSLSAAAGACASRGPALTPLPPIPERVGELKIDVVYPPENGSIASVDSNFIFGSVGDGRAKLKINGEPVPVEPNGAFLAFLPLPEATDDTLLEYELLATLAGRKERTVHRVRVIRSGLPFGHDAALIDSTSLAPRGLWWVREGEAITVSARAVPGARVRLLLPDGELVSMRDVSDSGSAGDWHRYEAIIDAHTPLGRGRRAAMPPPVPADPQMVAAMCAPLPASAFEWAETMSTDGAVFPPGFDPACAAVEVSVHEDTVRFPLPLDLWLLEEPFPYVETREAPSPAGSDGLVAGVASPGGTVTWLWPDRMRGRVSGRRNDAVRLDLDTAAEAWIPLRDLRWLAIPAPAARARVGAPRITSERGWLRLRVPIDRPVPFAIRIDDQRVTLILYDAAASSGTLAYGPADPFLRGATWEQTTADRYTLDLDLDQPPWGYRAAYVDGGLVVDIRRPPQIDPARPLVGRIIAIDPGHPPAGARGPTRLYEGDANLAIASRLRRLLEGEGATVVMTRIDQDPVRLYDRIRLAELMKAELLLSIHNNALPDGVNPFENNGTSVYYFHAHTIDLAQAVQTALLDAMGLADLGISRASLALARPVWIPAVLTEGAFMMIPAQEAALRSPEFQEAYARGVVEGLRAFLRGRTR